MLAGTFAFDTKKGFSSGSLMAWVVCLSAGLFFFYEFFQLNLFDVINQPLREDFHLDATALSLMSSMYLWADILFLLPAGVLLDRYSTRYVILWSMAVCVLGTFGFSAARSFILGAFCHFLTGIGNAFCFLACVVLVSRWFPPRRQALVIGTIVTMAFLGGMMAHTPLAFLSERYGWRYSMLIDGVVGAILFCWIFLFVKDAPHVISPVEIRQEKNSRFTYFLQALLNLQNGLAGLYTACLNLPVMVICALWGASFLQEVHHLPQLAASNIVSLIFMGSILGCPLVGWMSDTIGKRKPLMVVGAFATFATVLPLVLAHVLSEMQLSVLFFLLGLFSSTQVIAYPLIAESNPSHNTGIATAIASVIIMGGGGVGQVMFGWLMASHAGVLEHQYHIADFQFAMWMFPLTAFTALLAAIFLKETNCRAIT
jgi:MFS family permease